MAMSTGKAQINITPMIDVLLVLIIIFMVIAPLTPRGLNALVPQESKGETASAPETGREIVITVVGDGTVRLNQEVVALSALGERLVRFGGRVIFLRGDRALEFRQVAEVIDIA